MNIALIGGSGFVGTRLTELLKTSNHKILNIDKKNSPFHPQITTIENICNKEGLIPLLKDQDIVILLAAEHRDDIVSTSLYYDVNVVGTQNVLDAMDACGVKKIIFTSSVAVYGLNKVNPNEESPVDPFNHYGKSKWQAEEVLRKWYSKDSTSKTLTIIRPTVIFGERNRGNVYNLLRQIATGRFLKIGKCTNKKSMAYVGNVVALIEYLITNTNGYNIYNYIDKPDLSMNELIELVECSLNKKIPAIRIPYMLGMAGGYCFDLLAKITRKKMAISSIRVKKFCSTTQFDASSIHESGFKAPYSLSEGLSKTILYEFSNNRKDDVTFISE